MKEKEIEPMQDVLVWSSVNSLLLTKRSGSLKRFDGCESAKS